MLVPTSTRHQKSFPPPPCGCRSSRKGARAAILQRIALFGQRRDKPGAGYTCSLQAMSCVSRALPDLHRVKRKFKAILCNQSRPALQPLNQLQKSRRGVGGTAFLRFPRRLCARGSMTLRHAKAAPCYSSGRAQINHTFRKPTNPSLSFS